MPRPSVPPLGDVLEFLRLIWSVHHRVQEASRRMEARIGVTGQQRLVLRIIGRFPGSSAGRISNILAVHPSTLTGILQRLGRKGFIRRRSDRRDTRRSLFEITVRGQKLAHVSPGTIEAAVARMLTELPKSQIESARAALLGLVQAIETESEAAS